MQRRTPRRHPTELARRALLRGVGAAALGAPRLAGAALTTAPDEVLRFPDGFMFGVGTSAYQIEGSPTADGKGESIWDRWTHIPERTKLTGDVAADHYRRVKEDVALLRELGVDTYRFSIAWTRIFPDGDGAVNAKGVGFYRDLVRQLRDAGIKPMVTLFHWDTPQRLQDRGGWTNPQMADWFERYARTVFEALGDDVAVWTTFNEPWVTAFMGHHYGSHPPGLRDFSAALLVVHNILRAHGRAVAVHRERALRGKIGITLDLMYAYPASSSPEDRAAAERENRSHLGMFADPIFKGRYPADVLAYFSKRGVVLPRVTDEDLRGIARPVDFLGLNYYYPVWKKQAPPGVHWPLEHRDVPSENTKNHVGRADARGLYDLLRWASREYRTKLMITENGMNRDDQVNARGEVNDEERIEYLYAHLQAARRAMRDGVELLGYIHWTFMDNFEWGDWSRMGLVHTDFATGKRTIKRSGRWFRDGIRNGFSLPTARGA